jgi:putative ABC transport system permease protein
VGKQVFITGHDRDRSENTPSAYFTISGVYKSYLIGNLTGVDERPSALFYGEIGNTSNYMPHLFFKLTRTDEATLQKVQKALTDALEGKEINLISYEDSIRDAYTDSKKMRNTLVLGAIFSLLIAMLGLIGFIRDESQRRSKEMAIRKINGATTRDILGIFAWDIQKLSLVMAILGIAGAYYMASKWLEQFAQKVTLHPLYFIGGAAIVLAIVLAVVVLNSLRIAHANPVESLKNE